MVAIRPTSEHVTERLFLLVETGRVANHLEKIMKHVVPCLVLAAGLVMSACESDTLPTGFADRTQASESDLGPFASKVPTDFLDEGQLRLGVFTVCKIADADPTQEFEFEAIVTKGEGGEETVNQSLIDGECFDFWVDDDESGVDADFVEVTEQVLDGWMPNGITIYGLDSGDECPEPQGDALCVDGLEVMVMTDPAGTYTHAGEVDIRKAGCVLVYENVPTERGGEGCTPGAWKNRLLKIGAWALTGYSPDQTVQSVFSNVPASLLDDTLLEALSYGGGEGFDGMARILLRAGVAALLNAAHPGVDYPYTVAEVIDMVNDALASGDRDTAEDVADDLDAANNLGCDITDG